MAFSDLAIAPHKLHTEFFSDHVRPRTYSDSCWAGVESRYRDWELGRGVSGGVSLERSGKEGYWAMKKVAEYTYNRITDYWRELEPEVLAILSKVRDMDGPCTADNF